MVVKLSEQHAAVVEEVSRADAAVQVTDGGPQPGVQLRVDVKLPGIGRLLNLQGHTGQTVWAGSLKKTKQHKSQFQVKALMCRRPPPSYLQHYPLRGHRVGGLVHGGERSLSENTVHSQRRFSCQEETFSGSNHNI